MSSKLEVAKKIANSANLKPDAPGARLICQIFFTSKFDLWCFCSLFTYMIVKYLIWKIWFICVWSLKINILAALLRYFISIWIDPILLHERPKNWVFLYSILKTNCFDQLRCFLASSFREKYQDASSMWFELTCHIETLLSLTIS